jgi:anti-anti-sigma regulatory factor
MLIQVGLRQPGGEGREGAVLGKHLTVDLGRTSFLDASGLRVIARAHRALTPRCPLTLRSPTRQVRLVLEVSGLAGECPIEEPGQPR